MGSPKEEKCTKKGSNRSKRKGFIITDVEMYRDNDIQQETNLVKN
jgi:hypothetical protein